MTRPTKTLSALTLLILFAPLALSGCMGTRSAQETADMNIVEVAMAADDFATLVSLVETAELAGALTGEGPFTVFAPTDEAFAALGEETLSELLLPENRGTLTEILQYHVVPGLYVATPGTFGGGTDLQAAARTERIGTLNGTLPISDAQGTFRVGDASVVSADIKASNGVIHVIDRVLIPEGMDAGM